MSHRLVIYRRRDGPLDKPELAIDLHSVVKRTLCRITDVPLLDHVLLFLGKNRWRDARLFATDEPPLPVRTLQDCQGCLGIQTVRKYFPNHQGELADGPLAALQTDLLQALFPDFFDEMEQDAANDSDPESEPSQPLTQPDPSPPFLPPVGTPPLLLQDDDDDSTTDASIDLWEEPAGESQPVDLTQEPSFQHVVDLTAAEPIDLTQAEDAFHESDAESLAPMDIDPPPLAVCQRCRRLKSRCDKCFPCTRCIYKAKGIVGLGRQLCAGDITDAQCLATAEVLLLPDIEAAEEAALVEEYRG